MSTEVGSGIAASRIGGTLLRRGDALGRFLVLDSLGEGGMGAVVSAHDPNLDRVVAIKVLRPAALLGDGETEARTRLLREAQAMAKLQHANVITVHEVGEADDQIFIAMELVRSGSLRDWMEAGANRGWRDIVAMFRQTGRGLAAAHKAGLVHRDFKPENVLVTEDGVAKITDFGLVSADTFDLDRMPSNEDEELGDSACLIDITLTQTGALLGTPAYMAPEQHERAVEVDARADQFAFCVALWEALYGLRPFAGSTIVELAGSVLAGTIRMPPDKARVPGWIERALRRGLSPKPADRFDSMDALLDSLVADPSQARRRMLTWVVPALALAIAGFLVFGKPAAADRGATCAGFESRLAGVWDTNIKSKIEDASCHGAYRC
jgi:serine/threonine protein kinase